MKVNTMIALIGQEYQMMDGTLVECIDTDFKTNRFYAAILEDDSNHDDVKFRWVFTYNIKSKV